MAQKVSAEGARRLVADFENKCDGEVEEVLNGLRRLARHIVAVAQSLDLETDDEHEAEIEALASAGFDRHAAERLVRSHYEFSTDVERKIA